MKQCKHCHEIKSELNFHKDKKNSDGLFNKCKTCYQQNYMENRSRIKEVRDRYRKTEKSLTLSAKHKEKWNSNNKEKRAAHIKVMNALKNGKLKKENCQICGTTPVEAHHESYERPLNVNWFCRTHHIARHRQLRVMI